MSDIYIASSPMNILTSLMMIAERENEAILLLESFDNGATLSKQCLEDIKHKIEALKIEQLERVSVVSSQLTFKEKILGTNIFANAHKDSVDRIYSGNVWFTGISPLTRAVLQKERLNKSVEFYVLEDGTKMYLGDFQKWSKLSLRDRLKEVFLSDVNILKNSRINGWIVSDPDNYKFVERPVIENSDYYDKQSIGKFAQIFISDDEIEQLNELRRTENNVIIFTQPLFKSGLIDSIDTQKRLVRLLVEKHTDAADNIVIKRHPADDTDYSDVINQFQLLGNYPSEIINSFDITFKKSIGFFSSAVESVNAGEYIYDVEDYNLVSNQKIDI